MSVVNINFCVTDVEINLVMSLINANMQSVMDMEYGKSTRSKKRYGKIFSQNDQYPRMTIGERTQYHTWNSE